MTGSGPRRRFLLVTNHFGWGGAEKQLEHLAVGLAEAGHEVAMVATGLHIVDLAPLEAAGVEAVSLGAKGRLEKLWKLRELRRRAAAADLVHCTGWDATLWGRIAAWLARRPVVITEHTPGRDSQAEGTPGRAGAGTIAAHNRILDRVTYATITVGAWQHELLVSEGVRPDSIVHIPNGVPVEDLRRRAAAGPDRAEVGIPADSPLVVQVARFAPQKGQRLALGAVARLRERFGDVRLAFIGGGRDEELIKAEAEAAGADWATFLGFREDVPGIVSRADISILPSEAEGLPMSLLETLAVGTPIVGTDVGDVRWFLETSGAGLCIPPRDEDALVDACAEVLGGDGVAERLRASAVESAPLFDATTMVRRYEEVFEAAIASAPLPVVLSE